MAYRRVDESAKWRYKRGLVRGRKAGRAIMAHGRKAGEAVVKAAKAVGGRVAKTRAYDLLAGRTAKQHAAERNKWVKFVQNSPSRKHGTGHAQEGAKRALAASKLLRPKQRKVWAARAGVGAALGAAAGYGGYKLYKHLKRRSAMKARRMARKHEDVMLFTPQERLALQEALFELLSKEQ